MHNLLKFSGVIGSEGGGSWVAHFDNTEWETVFPGVWTGSAWSDSGVLFIPLTELGTWVEVYRPTKIRVTFTGGGTRDILLKDTENNFIAHETTASSEQEIDITFEGYDIEALQIQDTVGNFTVTNIEFFGG